MKFGFRKPSLKRRIAARTSPKRFIRHSLGLKAPRGAGWITNPKKAAYNRVYTRTSMDIFDTSKKIVNSKPNSSNTKLAPNNYLVVTPPSLVTIVNQSEGLGKDGALKILMFVGIIALFTAPPIGIILVIIAIIGLYRITKQSWYKVKTSILKGKKLVKKGDYASALEPLNYAYNHAKNREDIAYMLGLAQQGNAMYKESVKNLSMYVEATPLDVEAKIVLANSYYLDEDYKKAIPLLQAIPDDHLNYPLVILLLGDCFLNNKDYDMAINVFKRGPLRKRNLDDYLLKLHYLLGKAYLAKGKKKDALKHFNKVYSYDINYEDVEKQIKSLDS